MRLRARHMHHIEIFTDNVVGLVINYWLGRTILLMMGFPIDHGQNLILSGIIFVAAYARKYTIRRWFSNWINRIYKRRRADELQEQAGEN